MSLPSFIKKDPPPMAPPGPVEAANALGESVARLIAERDKLLEDFRLVSAHRDSLAAQLDRAERDRDHFSSKAEYFERFSMTITANFNTLRMIVDDIQRRANEFAKQPAALPEATPPAEPSPPDIVADLERSLADLQQKDTPQ